MRSGFAGRAANRHTLAPTSRLTGPQHSRIGTLAAKRGKSQARRNNGGGNNAIPGWAWLVLGLLLALVVYLVGSKYLGGEKNDFFRLQPNPDAQPAPIAEGEESVAPEGAADATDTPAQDDKDAAKDGKGKDKDKDQYDFYTLLPGKEVPVSDAELAATERAEAQRLEDQRKAQAAAKDAPSPAGDALPAPVDAVDGATPARATAPDAAKATTPPATGKTAPPAATIVADAATDNTRYLLQAGAFEASGQAEELKAKIAMLGLGARVESAQISGKTVYRVRMGPYGTAGDLSEAKRKLSAGGLPAMAIKVK